MCISDFTINNIPVIGDTTKHHSCAFPNPGILCVSMDEYLTNIMVVSLNVIPVFAWPRNLLVEKIYEIHQTV